MKKVTARDKLMDMFANCDVIPQELPSDELELFFWFKAANLVSYSNGKTEKDFNANGDVMMYYQCLCEHIRDYICELKGFDTNLFSDDFWGWYAEMQSVSNKCLDNVDKIKEYAKKFSYLVYCIRVNRAKSQFRAKEEHVDLMCAILKKTMTSE